LRTKTGRIARWGLASPLHVSVDRAHRRCSCRHTALARSPELTALLFRDTPAHGRPGPDHRPPCRSKLAMETPRLLSYRSFKDRLSIDMRPVRPLGTATSEEVLAPARPCQRLSRVPLLPFLTTSAVCSAPAGVGLLHPTADHEVHPVSSRPPTVADDATLLAGASPFEAFPSQQSGDPSPPENPGPKTGEHRSSPKPLPLATFAA
jgi:hypothetical protein